MVRTCKRCKRSWTIGPKKTSGRVYFECTKEFCYNARKTLVETSYREIQTICGILRLVLKASVVE